MRWAVGALLAVALSIGSCSRGVGYDRGYHVIVAQPVSAPVALACAAETLGGDSGFRATDSMSHSWRMREDSVSIGILRWAGRYGRRSAALYHAPGGDVDTVVGKARWIGVRPTRAEIAEADSVLSAAVDTLVRVCGRASGARSCTHLSTGGPQLACARP
jgi:hypothetical protein